MKLIELKNVSKLYNDSLVLDSINLSFSSCGLYIIKGESGSGKTTLLNIISKLDNPTTGEIKYNGEIKLGYVFQDNQLIDYLTIKENLEIIKANLEDLDKYIIEYHLEDLLDKFPYELSGGEQKKVAIARTLLSGANVLICDEPLSSLDSDTKEEVSALLYEISKKMLVIVSSHEELKTDEALAFKLIIENTKVKIKHIPNLEEEKELLLPRKTKIKQKILIKRLISSKWPLNIISCVMLTISLLFLAVSITITNINMASIMNDYYSDNQTIDLAKRNDGNISYSISEDELSSFKEIDARLIYGNWPIYELNQVSFRRIYITDKTNRELACGKGVLNYKECLISDYIANIICRKAGFKKYEDVLGYELKHQFITTKVVGVINTGFSIKEDSTFEVSNLINESKCLMYLNNQTYKDIYGESNAFSSVETKAGLTTHSFSVNEKLTDSDCYIYKHYATENDIKINDLLEIKFKLEDHGKIIREETVTIRVVDVKEDSSTDFECSPEMLTIAKKYQTVSNSAIYGVSIINPGYKGIKNLLNENYIDAGYMSESVSLSFLKLNELSYFLKVGICTILVLLFFVLSHLVLSLLQSEKRTLGLITSFGMKKKNTILLYMTPVIIITLTAFVSTCLLYYPCLRIVSSILIKQKGFMLDLLKVDLLSLLLTLAIMLIYLGLIYLYLVLRLKKKTTMDFIYER